MRGLRYDRILAGTALALVLAAPYGAQAQRATTAAIEAEMPLWLALAAFFVFFFKLGILPGGGRLDPGLDPPPQVTVQFTPPFPGSLVTVALTICVPPAVMDEGGADVNATNVSGQTALHGAAYMGGNKVVELLLHRGARVNVQDAQSQTPFRIAEAHLNVAGQGVTLFGTNSVRVPSFFARSMAIPKLMSGRRNLTGFPSTTSYPSLS